MRKPVRVLYLASGFAIVLASLYGFWLLRARPGVPASLRGREVLRINRVAIRSADDIDFALSGTRIGDEAEFGLRSTGGMEILRGRLVAYYSQTSFPFIFLLIGMSGFLIGGSVLILKPEDRRARIFFWMAFCFSASLIINGDYYCVRDKAASLAPGVLFNFAYPMVSAPFPGLLADLFPPACPAGRLGPLPSRGDPWNAVEHRIPGVRSGIVQAAL